MVRGFFSSAGSGVHRTRDFSGTGFCTKEGKPAIIYHGQGSGRNQIAVAEDDQLEKWSKPWKLEPRIQLRVFIDKNLVEVFVNDRQAAVSARNFVPENQGIQLVSKDGDVVVKEFKCWKMKSIYAGK